MTLEKNPDGSTLIQSNQYNTSRHNLGEKIG